ncbi:MAG: thiol reductant ABC exporter subunit CydD [Solirubrobacterales bacterium 70-9]|nr:MAG: thiol reductant ABC exporter subunit CydD [Solirubrobacterales bacterium 70-9]
MALGLVATVLIVAQATLLAHVVVDAFLGGASLADLVPQLAAVLGVSLARGAVDFGFEASGRAGAARVMADLRSRLVRHLLLERPGALSGERSGELAAASVHGVDALEAYYARYLPQAVLAALAPIAILAWTIPRDWEAAAILAVTAPLVPIFMVLIGRLAEAATRRRYRRLARLSSRFLDLVGGLETLRANGRAAAQAESIAAAGESYRRETMATLRIGFLSALVLELLAMIGVALVAATVGIQLAEGSLGLTAGLTVLILAPEVYMPLRRLGSEFHAASDAMAAAEAIFEVLDRPGAVAVPGSADAATRPGEAEDPVGSTPARPRPAPDPALAPIVLSGVTFTHAGRESVLDGVDLELRPRETVALVGPSGGGKSTLLSLLLRLADPDAGTISCGGVDLREVDPAAWHRRLAWVPQRPTIFAGTVAENIALGRPEASRAEIERAAHEAMLAPVLELLPDGLDTRVGEDARRLSAGQAQRVGLARAFLLDAPLVLLDEPTAHLDAATEREVVAAIDRLCAERTALIVAHREAAIRGADRVLVLRHGRIAPAPMSMGRKPAYMSGFRPIDAEVRV